MKRLVVTLLAAVFALAALLNTAPASAAQRSRCFSETGFCIAGNILGYWERNGGLPVFGYPISNLETETNNDGWTGPTQWFERDRLEDHGQEGILAGRLGAQYLERQGRAWTYGSEKPQPGYSLCTLFSETGYNLCPPFSTYWRENGGLERFGYPITPPVQEMVEGQVYLVQYFERRRMEYHPENAGTAYEVLLGLLGRDLRNPSSGCANVALALQKTAAAYPAYFGCAAPFPQVDIPLATEQFERGTMVWVPSPNNGQGWIWVIYFDNGRNSLVWENYPDTWKEGEALSGGEAAPPGLYEPTRGFGKLWRTNPHVRNTLGWAAAPEVATRGSQQYFKGGAWMIYRGDSDRVFLLYPDYRVDDVQRIK